ncbi:hypothetical protein [Alistipes putredinis]|uniref:hypothetical protein n=1 Tax=Alistipes putredinis TaxID=28117 RepID=UPI003AAE085F
MKTLNDRDQLCRRVRIIPLEVIVRQENLFGLTLVKHFALLHSGWYFIIVILFSGNSSPHS